MRAPSYWFAALLALASAASGLDPSLSLTQYGHTAWLVRDGYFAGGPTVITQTLDGFLWIGTQTGLVRFDGVRFTPWEPPPGSSLPDARIVNLLGTRDGSLWIGTANGLARWDGSRLMVYARAGRFGALAEDRRGTVWAGHTRALAEVPPLCRFERERFRCFRFPAENRLAYVGALYEDPQGDVWIGGESGVCRWRPTAPGLDCHAIEALATLAGKSGIFGIASDSEGALWAGTGQTGIWRLAGGRWTSYPAPPEPPLDAALILRDRAGALWIGPASGGLIRRTRGRTELLTRADGLSGEAVSSLYEDREGNVWVTTAAGIDRFRDLKVATLTSREGMPWGYVSAVTASRDGGVWVSDRRRLVHLGTAGASSYGVEQGLPGNGPTSLLEDSRGRLWMGVDNGLAWWEQGRFHTLRMADGAATGVVLSMTEDREGNLWAATIHPDHTLLRVRDGRVAEAFPAARLGAPAAAVAAAVAASPEGGVWIGLNSGDVKLYRGGSFEMQGHTGSRSIHSLRPDARGLWAVTSQGLRLLRKGAWATLGARNGLPCDDVGDILPGDGGSLWMKTACGLVEIPAGELGAWLEDPGRHVRVRVFDALDGAQAGLPPFTPRAARSLDGRLWFAIEGGGLQVLDPRSLKDNAVAPPVQILRVVAGRKDYGSGPGMRLPPLTRDLEIDYTALSLAMPEKVRFRYRLESGPGAAAGWQEAGTRREAFYTNLAPGSYRFRVLACNEDGIWSPEGAALAFAILPAFYQTRLFLAFCAAGIAGLAWAAYRWRMRQVRASLSRLFEERLAERIRVAQDLHDTLLQGFLSASMQLYAAVEELPSDAPARGRFGRVQELMRQVIEEGRGALRGLRSLEPREDDLEHLLSRVPGELGIPEAADFHILSRGRPRPLLPAVRDEIHRVAREAVMNAFRHADASRIEVEIERGAARLRVVVRDDGRGIDPEVLRAGREGHWGLSGMRERVERIGGRLQVRSRAGAGTEIEISLPSRIAYADAAGPSWWARWRQGES